MLATPPNAPASVDTAGRLAASLAVLLPALGFDAARVHLAGATAITRDRGALELLVRAGAWSGIDWKAPFFLFGLLVAIGADYGVFLLRRAREEERSGRDRAIARALEVTGPVVTS